MGLLSDWIVMWNYLSGVKYEMENEKDLSDSEIESDLEEDI